MKHTNVLLAGATGYLGGFLLKVLIERKNQVVAIVRNPDSLQNDHENYLEIKQAQVTRPETLRDICKGIDTVISTVGITRQKDGLTYMDVDYQANMNLLEEAKKADVKHFVYVSAINGDKHRNLKILEAKEKFVDALKASGLHYTIVRPNGFFGIALYHRTAEWFFLGYEGFFRNGEIGTCLFVRFRPSKIQSYPWR